MVKVWSKKTARIFPCRFLQSGLNRYEPLCRSRLRLYSLQNLLADVEADLHGEWLKVYFYEIEFAKYIYLS